MRHSLLAGVLLACTPFAATASCLEAMVFNDTNGNGMRDINERGLPGIRISDGEHIVATDKAGRYQLPASAPHRVAMACRISGVPTAAKAAHAAPSRWHHNAMRPPNSKPW